MPSRPARRVTISHVAAAFGVDPVGDVGGLVRGVMVDDHAGQAREQVGVARGHGTDPLQGAAVRDDQQVVGRVGIRVGPEALDTRHEVVERAGPGPCTPGR